MNNESKICAKCKSDLPLDSFRWRKSDNRYESYCKLCEAAYKRKWGQDEDKELRKIKRRSHKINRESLRKADRSYNHTSKGYYRKIKFYTERLGIEFCDCCKRKLWWARNTK